MYGGGAFGEARLAYASYWFERMQGANRVLKVPVSGPSWPALTLKMLGFLQLRQGIFLICQNYGSGGWGFKSLRAHHRINRLHTRAKLLHYVKQMNEEQPTARACLSKKPRSRRYGDYCHCGNVGAEWAAARLCERFDPSDPQFC